MNNDIPGVIVLDDFLPDFQKARTHAINSEFYDWQAPDGEIYRRISLLHVPGLLSALENNLGPVKIQMSGYRLNYADELPNQNIHSDLAFSTHAAVVYFNPGESGTAFWEHKKTGAISINYGQSDLFEELKEDFNNPSAWNLRGIISSVPNRAVIYRGNLFHSRYPFKAFGSTPEDGRLIAVAFFSFPEGV